MDWPQACVWMVGMVCGTILFCVVAGACFQPPKTCEHREIEPDDDEEFAE